MSTAHELQRTVLDTLQQEPLVDSAALGVGVVDGIVRLMGDVTSEVEKQLIARTAKRVIGVRAIANDLKVRPPQTRTHTDTAVAQLIVQALAWDTLVPHHSIQATVSNGHVTLEGQVDWLYQRDAARQAVCNFSGVTGVTNLLTIRAPVIEEERTESPPPTPDSTTRQPVAPSNGDGTSRS